MNELEKILLEFEGYWTGQAADFKKALFEFYVKEVLGLQKDAFSIYRANGDDLLTVYIELDELFKTWFDKSLISDIKDLVPDMERINSKIEKLNRDVNGLELNGNVFKDLNFAQRNVINEIGVSFKDIGFNKVLKQSLAAAVSNGLSLNGFRDVVKVNLERTKAQTDARFNQITNDAYSQYIGNVNKVIEDNYDIKGYLYAPLSVVDSTRPLCKGAIKDKKGYISVSELPSFVSKYTSSKELSKGLVDGFSVNDFKHNTGKPNCRHLATPSTMTREQLGKRFNISL